MATGPFLRAAVVGMLGSVVLGILVRDVVPMAVGMAVVGVVAGLVSTGRLGLAGLWSGQIASFAALWAIQFGTTVDTFINTEDVAQVLGFWPLIVAIWLGFLGSAAVGFVVGSRVVTLRRSSQP